MWIQKVKQGQIVSYMIMFFGIYERKIQYVGNNQMYWKKDLINRKAFIIRIKYIKKVQYVEKKPYVLKENSACWKIKHNIHT